MMSQLTTYVFNNQPVTVLFDSSDNPWFKAKEVAEILGYQDTKQAVKLNVDEEDKDNALNVLSKEGCINTTLDIRCNIHFQTKFINESGLYSLIFSSNKPQAKAFKKWVTSEVLPSIRKHGEYKLRNENQQLLQTLNRSLETNLQVIKANQQLVASHTQLKTENQSMNQMLCDQAPKVAVLPEDPELKHVFCVLSKEDLLELYGVTEYKCIRTQKRKFIHALNKAKQQGFDVCYYRENIPNGVNVLNKAKEVMRSYSMHYDSANNNILTKHNFVNIVEHVIDNA